METDRQALVLAFRKHGVFYRKIADQVSRRERNIPHYGPSQAYADVMAALRKGNTRNAELAANLRRRELERLDDLHAVFWPKALKGAYAALARIVNLMVQRARCLDLYRGKEGEKVDITVFIRHVAEEYGLDPDEAVKVAEKIVARSR